LSIPPDLHGEVSLRPYLLIFCTLILWSSSFVVIRHLVQSIDPVSLASLRLIIAGGLVAVCIGCRHGLFRVRLKDFCGIAVLGIIGIAVYNIALIKGEKSVDAGTAAFIIGQTPVFASLFATTRKQLRETLQGLHPWRKGPFDLFGIRIDTEWRSDWKWDRVLPHISPLKDRMVLDVGCGNGYHCLRMAGEQARRVIGIDPSSRFVYQFYAIKHFMNDVAVDVLPLGIEAVPSNLRAFDTVFSMGIFYHRRSPMDHLRDLKDCLRPDGELVLETLIVDGPEGPSKIPTVLYFIAGSTKSLPCF